MLTFAGAYYGWGLLSVPLAFIVLFGFFFSSIGFSRIGRAQKRQLVDVPKGGPRDAWQVAANGGVATLCAIVAALMSHQTTATTHWAFALFWAFAGAYSAATADTWATEIGSAFGGTPRSLAGFRVVAPGVSGGVTVLGSAAMLAGAAWIGLLWAFPQGSLRAFAAIAFAGCAGAIVDSLLGASLQAIYACPRCERETETPVHLCGEKTVLARGLHWMTNDVVNALGTLTGALAGAALFLAFL